MTKQTKDIQVPPPPVLAEFDQEAFATGWEDGYRRTDYAALPGDPAAYWRLIPLTQVSLDVVS